MENASKALLIAGAILICILLIAIGMYIYQQANGVIKSAASNMSQQDKDAYNATAKSYMGEVVKGNQVRAMIDSLISQNDGNVGDSGKFVGIGIDGNIPNYSKKGELNKACKEANVYLGGDNGQDKVNAAKVQMRELKKAIVSGKNYSVLDTAEGQASGTTDGIIHTLYIKDLSNTTP